MVFFWFFLLPFAVFYVLYIGQIFRLHLLCIVVCSATLLLHCSKLQEGV